MSQVSQLLIEAQAAPAKPSRSKLEEHRAAIAALRQKRWTYAAIAKWLRERGVEATTSNVHRFCHATKRAATPPPQFKSESKPTTPEPPPTGEVKPKRKYRFNLDV